MEQQSVYKKQQKLTFLLILMELPNFVAVSISAIVSHSLLVWLDFIDSAGNVLSECLVMILSRHISRDLRYEYNYGVGKIEAMTALFCESITLCGLLFVMGSSVAQLFSPEKPSDFLVFVVVLKVINVLVDAMILREQAKIKNESSTHITQNEYISDVNALLFDAGALVSLLCVWLMRNLVFSWYISPILSLGIAIYMFVICLRHVRQAIIDLSDKTLPEEEQLKILKVLSGHDKEYLLFGGIKSRYNGTDVMVDISVEFSPDTRFEEISRFQNELQKELSREIENCCVAVVIDGFNEKIETLSQQGGKSDEIPEKNLRKNDRR